MEHSNTTETLDSDTTETLQGLNDKLSGLLLGALIFVAAMMVIGFVGNLHVLIFYAFRMKSTNHRNFILFLSSLDLTSCIVGMPLTIYTLKEPLLYATNATCKLHIFINYFVCIASAFTLFVIAFERYRKICKPFGWQLSRRYAKIACLLVLIGALVCSVPVLVMYESERRKSTQYPWISAEICVERDQISFSQYHISLATIFTFLLFLLITLYTLIWKATTSCSISKIHTTQCTEVKNASVISTSANDLFTSTTTDPVDNKVKIVKDTEMNNNCRQTSKSRKLTLAFSLITIVFFISYIPYLALNIVLGNIDDVPNFSESEYIVFRMAFYFVYVSNTTNCFIYGFTNMKFRHEVKAMYVKLFSCETFLINVFIHTI